MDWFIIAHIIDCLNDYRLLLQSLHEREKYNFVGYLISRLLELQNQFKGEF